MRGCPASRAPRRQPQRILLWFGTRSDNFQWARKVRAVPQPDLRVCGPYRVSAPERESGRGVSPRNCLRRQDCLRRCIPKCRGGPERRLDKEQTASLPLPATLLRFLTNLIEDCFAIQAFASIEG